MSESERLARERLQNGYQTGFIADPADYGHAQSNGAQSKSWEKSSKWSSQNEVSE